MASWPHGFHVSATSQVEESLLEPAPQRDHRSHGDESPDGGQCVRPGFPPFGFSWATRLLTSLDVLEMDLEF